MTMRTMVPAAAWCALAVCPVMAMEWTDSTGKFTLEGELIAFDDATVVLKKENHDMIAVQVEKLSAANRDYLKMKEVEEWQRKVADLLQSWTFRDGKKAIGRIVGYGRKDVVVQLRRNKIYVNDRRFDNLPEIYQYMLPKIVNHFENTKIEDKEQFAAWVEKQRGRPRKFTCKGVVFELDSGDEYVIPFIFFTAEDLEILRPGWDKWDAAENDAAQRSQQDLFLQALVRTYQYDKEISRQVMLLSKAEEWFDLWEVQMAPKPGAAGDPQLVTVRGRDRHQAQAAAAAKYPNLTVGATRKVQRRN